MNYESHHLMEYYWDEKKNNFDNVKITKGFLESIFIYRGEVNQIEIFDPVYRKFIVAILKRLEVNWNKDLYKFATKKGLNDVVQYLGQFSDCVDVDIGLINGLLTDNNAKTSVLNILSKYNFSQKLYIMKNLKSNQ